MGYTLEKKKDRFKNIADRQNAYKELFQSTDLGQIVLEDIFDECAINRTAFCKGDDPQTNVNLGKQLVGYHILKMLNIQLQEIDND